MWKQKNRDIRSENKNEYELNDESYSFLALCGLNVNEFREHQKLKNDGTITIDDLVNAFLELQKREEYHKPVQTRITRKELSVEEKTFYIRDILKKQEQNKTSKLPDEEKQISQQTVKQQNLTFR